MKLEKLNALVDKVTKMNSIDALLYLQLELSQHMYYIGEEASKHYQTMTIYNNTRKIKHSENKTKFTSNGSSIADAESNAIINTKHLRMKEAEAESLYKKYYFIYKSLNASIEAIRQKISYLKIELQTTKKN